MIIDFHVHCFPDSLAPRALGSLREHALGNPDFPCTDGTVAGTISHLSSSGIDAGVVCNIATNARQQHNVNSFAIGIAKMRNMLIPLGSLHPHGENKRGELLGLRAAGIKGIKIHPDYIGLEIDHPDYNEIFELCSEFGFFVVTHAGLDPVSPEHLHARPSAIATVLDRYPDLKLIAAHMGGFERSAEALECLVGKRNLWLDTSMSSQRPDEVGALHKILRSHPPDRLLFASDTPWSFIEDELKFLYSANLGDAANEKILCKNALALLGER